MAQKLRQILLCQRMAVGNGCEGLGIGSRMFWKL